MLSILSAISSLCVTHKTAAPFLLTYATRLSSTRFSVLLSRPVMKPKVYGSDDCQFTQKEERRAG